MSLQHRRDQECDIPIRSMPVVSRAAGPGGGTPARWPSGGALPGVDVGERLEVDHGARPAGRDTELLQGRQELLRREPVRLGASSAASTKPSPALVDEGPLSARELEVAALVAAGRPNEQIAAELYLSERTAQNHVQHILTKLGVANRIQVGAWNHAHVGSRGASRTLGL